MTDTDRRHAAPFLDATAVERLCNGSYETGGLAQLARALAWHARGHRFDSDILHLRPNPFPDGRQNAH